jgi:hypothetical protein
MQKARPFSRTDMGNRGSDQLTGFLRVGSIPVQHLQITKRGQVRGDIPGGGLQASGDGNAVTVVLDEEEQWELEGGGHRQSGPEAVGCHAAIPSGHNRNRAVPICLIQDAPPVPDRLGPPGCGRILSANIAGGGQDRWPVPAGKVENHAYIPALARAAHPGHTGCQGFRRREPAGQQQRPRPVVHCGSIVGMDQSLGQQHLSQFMAHGRELVLYLALGSEFLLFQLVDRPGEQDKPGDFAPINCRVCHEVSFPSLIENLLAILE